MLIASRPPDPPHTLEDLLGRDLMSRLDRLDLHSRKLFAGKMPGERRSKRRGQSVEFDDHRDYVPGDDLRHLDWNVFARLDRFFIRLFREEEDLTFHILVDASASMQAATVGEDGSVVTKALFAHRLAMALGYIGLVAGNRVQLTSFGGPSGFTRTSPGRGRSHVRHLASFLLESLDRPGTLDRPAPEPFEASIRRFVRSRGGKGVVVLLSDLLIPEGYEAGLAMLGGVGAGYDTHCLQVLSPGEIDPLLEGSAVTGDLRLTDIETNRAAEVSVSRDAIERYRERVREYTDGLARFARARDMRHLLVPTDTPLDALLLRRLRQTGLLR